MARYIDAESLRKESKMLYSTHSFEPVEAYTQDQIDNAPAADVQEVRRGEWLNFVGDFSTAECDKCGEIYEVTPDEKPNEEFFNAFKQFYKFCPNCGAKMEGE